MNSLTLPVSLCLAAACAAQVPSLLLDIHPTGSSLPSQYTQIAGKTVFVATDATHGRELWVTDGTTAGTNLLADVHTGAVGSDPNELTLVANRIWFRAETSATGKELGYTNGKPNGTFLLNAAPGPLGSNPRELTAFGDRLLFVAVGGFGNARRLWRIDANSTQPVQLAAVGGSGLGSADPTVVGNKAFFCRNELDGTRTLMVTDGTPSGTASIGNFQQIASLTAAGSRLAFAADDGSHGMEPWVSDGTSTGTWMVDDVHPGSGASSPDDFCYHAPTDEVLFRADNGSDGVELWRHDGQTAVMAFHIYPGPNGANPSRLVSDGFRYVYMVAQSSITGSELYRFYPETSGIGVISSVAAGSADASPLSLCWTGQRLFFAANDGSLGHELYVHDSYTGTLLAADVAPGSASSLPSGLTIKNGGMILTADDGVHGREPFVLDPGANIATVSQASVVRDLPLALVAEAPRLGVGWDLRVQGHQAGDVALLAFGVPGSPFELLDCWLSFSLVEPITTSAAVLASDSSWTTTMPLSSSLPSGVTLAVQGAVFGPGAQLEMTNAVFATTGQ